MNKNTFQQDLSLPESTSQFQKPSMETFLEILLIVVQD